MKLRMGNLRVDTEKVRSEAWNLSTDYTSVMDRDSSVGIATGYGPDGQGIDYRWGTRFSAASLGPGAHPASHTMGTGSFPGVKRPERSFDHPLHLAPRLKKE